MVARVLQRCHEAPAGSRLRRMRLVTALPIWPRRGLVRETLPRAPLAPVPGQGGWEGKCAPGVGKWEGGRGRA